MGALKFSTSVGSRSFYSTFALGAMRARESSSKPFQDLLTKSLVQTSNLTCRHKFDIREQLQEGGFRRYDFGIGFNVVAADLGREIIAHYAHIPILGSTTCTFGFPWRLRIRYMIRPLQWRFHRVKGYAKSLLHWSKMQTMNFVTMTFKCEQCGRT